MSRRAGRERCLVLGEAKDARGPARRLQEAGCQVIAVPEPDELLERLLDGIPDALLLALPALDDALECAADLAGRPSLAGVPVVLVGRAGPWAVRDADAAGAADAVAPSGPDLVERVRGLVRLGRAARAARAAPDPLDRLLGALARHDPVLGPHSRCTAELALSLARALGLPPDEQEVVRLAARLHDLGHLATPPRLIDRREADDPDVRVGLQRHARDGAWLARQLGFLASAVVDAVRHAHERLDGTGYPDGLTEAAIPREVRLLTLADMVEVMSRPGPGRAALSLDVCRRLIAGGVGAGWFDGDLVEAVEPALGAFLVARLRSRRADDPPPFRPRSPARLRPTDPPRVPPAPAYSLIRR